jgi:hypothetical protein
MGFDARSAEAADAEVGPVAISRRLDEALRLERLEYAENRARSKIGKFEA